MNPCLKLPETPPKQVLRSGFPMPRYIRTVSGKMFKTAPSPEDFCREDIAHGLAIAPRWGGQARWRYPVAAHCIYVAMMLPDEFKFDGLMHDTSEAYFCDIPSPFKALMPEYKAIENNIMAAAAKRFEFCWPPPELVKVADAVALMKEHEAFFGNSFPNDVPKIKIPSSIRVPERWDFSEWETMPVSTIKSLFISKFNEHKPR